MKYPDYRPRRMRRTESLRQLVRETHLSADQLIMPYFVAEGGKKKDPIVSMPGQFRFSTEGILAELDDLSRVGLRHILLFGIPAKKDSKASEAYRARGIIQRAIRMIKRKFPKITVISDVCLCEYADHGHCGLIKDGEVDNDETLKRLAAAALSHAEAGVDMVAPSDMMDGRVGAIRRALDQKGFEDLPIMSYAAKYASAFYGPFREAAHSAPKFGDRKSYQMDPANREEALREIRMDLDEGADLVMVKPALAYLDVIYAVKSTFHIPVAAYQVSGEYVMIKSAAQKGFVNERSLVLESLLAMKRAGATAILTYFAKEVSGWLQA